jgi:GNAT superfamily N-acetyltransferase
MATTTETTHLAESQLEEASDMLGRAFHDNPMEVYIQPDEGERARNLGWMLGTWTRYGHLYGEVYTTTGRVDGAAVWLTPESPPMSRETITAAGMAEIPQRLGQEAFQRLMTCGNHFDELRRREAPEPHWYLWTLGVDPPRQGQGVGSALLQPVLARADEAGLPCYVGTTKAVNVPFYQRHGFEVLVEDDLPGAGFHYWTFKRPGARGSTAST